jgi:hypothetical protein
MKRTQVRGRSWRANLAKEMRSARCGKQVRCRISGVAKLFKSERESGIPKESWTRTAIVKIALGQTSEGVLRVVEPLVKAYLGTAGGSEDLRVAVGNELFVAIVSAWSRTLFSVCHYPKDLDSLTDRQFAGLLVLGLLEPLRRKSSHTRELPVGSITFDPADLQEASRVSEGDSRAEHLPGGVRTRNVNSILQAYLDVGAGDLLHQYLMGCCWGKTMRTLIPWLFKDVEQGGVRKYSEYAMICGTTRGNVRSCINRVVGHCRDFYLVYRQMKERKPA